MSTARTVLDDAGVLGRVQLQAAKQYSQLAPLTVSSRVW